MNEQLLIKNIAEIGKLLLKNGAEIYRVEESLERMCQSYGFQDIGVFALPTYFTMSVTFQDGTSTSLTKRTLQNRTNLDAVCALNDHATCSFRVWFRGWRLCYFFWRWTS